MFISQQIVIKFRTQIGDIIYNRTVSNFQVKS